MKRLLQSLILSGKHLYLLDEVLRVNYPPYAEIEQKLFNLPLYEELRKEVYAGGKKRGIYGYGRQMILGDLIQYILTGRGYYFAIKGKEHREAFIRILMHIINELILMEDISVDVSLRSKVLDALEQSIGANLFEDEEQKASFYKLRKYKGKIVPGVGREYDDILDSILPKRVGTVPELLVYAYLIRKNYGYVVPLLQAQRLLGNQGFIVPPDFLLLRSKGEIFGIEVGKGKERQITLFSTVTSIPVFTVNVGIGEQPQPYRCGKCQKWIIYCDEVINLCATNKDQRGQEYINCEECPSFNDANCPQIVYFGRAPDYSGEIRVLRYHYSCVRDEDEVKGVLYRAREPKLISPLPWISGLEHLTEEPIFELQGQKEEDQLQLEI